MNELCPKHDKIYTESHPCPGCETEKVTLLQKIEAEAEKVKEIVEVILDPADALSKH
ncbi:MAG: hypothetical protein ABSH01_27720 [Terriglobia bacterium]|jgi:Fe-S cluster biogenesis protein NfuA